MTRDQRIEKEEDDFFTLGKAAHEKIDAWFKKLSPEMQADIEQMEKDFLSRP